MSELVDYERAWLHLKAYIGPKRNHGAKDLLAYMAALEVESMYAESGPPPRTAADNDAGHLDSAAAEAPAEATPGDQTKTPEEASWHSPAPKISPTSSPQERETTLSAAA